MDKHILVEHLSTIKTAICETFQNTQRIKLISFDVSSHYIILGTSSGGIYIFKRKPCEFLRLIPSKEGPTIHIKVCQNETNLAIATAKGLVIILENYFVDFNIRPFLFPEHEKCSVTVMTWHGNDLYCGDNAGKVSVCSVLSTLTQAIFQSPSSTLMYLDSSIIQIDAWKKYLLISTKTRTYLCDTEKEQYKQIGKKPRDGSFGACFSQTDETYYLHKNQGVRKEFKTLQELENFDNVLSDDVKIYCARPGARVWAADFEASVLTTFQFRNSLNMKSADLLIVVNENKECRLNIKVPDGVEVSENFSFGKIYPLYQNIIVAYDKLGIYFFDLGTSCLLCWSHTFDNIKDIKILKPYIYVWRQDLQIDIISLYPLEELITSTLLNRQYLLCAEICERFNEDVLNLIEKSKKINLISILETKLKGTGNEALENDLKNIFEKLKEFRNDQQKLGVKLENGIVVVENQYLIENLPEAVQVGPSSTDQNFEILYKQYTLNKVNKLAELTDSARILNTLELEEILPVLEEFTKYVTNKYREDASSWCKQQLVKVTSKSSGNIDEPILEAVTKAFLDLNNFERDCCTCKFPLPVAHTRRLQYFELACRLYELSKSKDRFLCVTPVLYKHRIRNLKEKTLNLSLIVQFSDKEVFKECFKDFTYDVWDEILKLFTKLQNGSCVNCNANLPVEGLLTWTEVGALMVESVGAKNAVRLLRRYIPFISDKLDMEFYQSCIFSLACEDRGLALRFVESTKTAGNSKQFGDCLEQFLQKKYFRGQSQPPNQARSVDSTLCSYCQLPIDHPVLVDVKKCECGLTFHQICCVNNNICKFCVSFSN